MAARSPSSALIPFFGDPTEIDYRKKGHPYSNLSTGGPRLVWGGVGGLGVWGFGDLGVWGFGDFGGLGGLGGLWGHDKCGVGPNRCRVAKGGVSRAGGAGQLRVSSSFHLRRWGNHGSTRMEQLVPSRVAPFRESKDRLIFPP